MDEDAIGFLPEVARRTHGYVGADLMELVRQAGLTALRRAAGRGFTALKSAGCLKHIVVTKDDFASAVEKTSPSALRETLWVTPDVGWADIGGLKTVIAQLRDAVEAPLIYPDAFARLGLRRSTGILLYGPPGTGKTMLAKALANECGANFIPVNGPEIFSMWLGESEQTIRNVFQMARQVQPTVILFDQIDAIAARRRGEAANATTERVVNQLLAEMDGLRASSQVIVVAATNRRDLLDPALLRPGRLGLEIYVGLPEQAERSEIVKALLANSLSPMTASAWSKRCIRLPKPPRDFPAPSYRRSASAPNSSRSGLETIAKMSPCRCLICAPLWRRFSRSAPTPLRRWREPLENMPSAK